MAKTRIPKHMRVQKNAGPPKWVPCNACNGTGYYDHNGSPPCGACNGSGTMKPIIYKS